MLGTLNVSYVEGRSWSPSFFWGGFFLGTHVKDAFKLSWIVVQYEYEYGKFFTWFQCERRLQVSDNIAKKNKHETKKKTWEEAGNNKVREQMLLNIICPSPSPRGMVVRSNMAT